MKFSIRCSFSAKMCTYYSPNMAYLNSTLIHTLLPEKHGIFFVKLIQSTHDKKKQPLPQSCSYKAWERHHDSLIGMCGCTKIRCFVRLKTPRKLLLHKLSTTNKALKYTCDFCVLYKYA